MNELPFAVQRPADGEAGFGALLRLVREQEGLLRLA